MNEQERLCCWCGMPASHHPGSYKEQVLASDSRTIVYSREHAHLFRRDLLNAGLDDALPQSWLSRQPLLGREEAEAVQRVLDWANEVHCVDNYTS